MTSQSPRIYLYKITFEEIPYYYYGVKKEEYYNQKYFGSPIEHKWCWELYTPKKQILEFFDYTDEGYIKAQEIEKKLIKLFINDKWCLNENVGGIISIERCRKGGIMMGNYLYENGLGIHGLTKEQRVENGKKGNKEGKRKSGKNAYLMKTGIHAFTPEEKSETGKKGGKIGGSIVCSQRWRCLVTGYIAAAGPLASYQKARGIDKSLRERLS